MSYPGRILFIDDDEEEQFIFKMACSSLSCPIELVCEQNCNAAIANLTNRTVDLPDIIFIDWFMPTFNGGECLYQIRQIPSCSTIPIVIISGLASDVLLEEAKRLGATLVMKKPSKLSELTKELERIFSAAQPAADDRISK